jgi:hypothetical protein
MIGSDPTQRFRSRKWNLSSTTPPAPFGKENVEFVQDPIGKLAIAGWVTRGAGQSGGSGIFRTKFGLEPPDPADGDVDAYSNASVISRFSAIVNDWQTYGPMFALERPLPSGVAVNEKFTAIRQGAATTDITHGGIHMLAPIGSGFHAWVRALQSPLAAPVDYSFQVSHDNHPEHWEELLTLTADAFLTVDEIGFFLNEASGLFNLRTTLLHWLEDEEA